MVWRWKKNLVLSHLRNIELVLHLVTDLSHLGSNLGQATSDGSFIFRFSQEIKEIIFQYSINNLLIDHFVKSETEIMLCHLIFNMFHNLMSLVLIVQNYSVLIWFNMYAYFFLILNNFYKFSDINIILILIHNNRHH